MAKTKREFIIVTFIISCVAITLSVVCMSTDYWVLGSLKPNIQVLESAELNYGLFKGSFTQKYLQIQSKEYNLAMVCVFKENICGYSYLEDLDDRKQEIEDIFNNVLCKNSKTKKRYVNIRNPEVTTNDDVIDYTVCDLNFINSALWVITILFLCLSIVMSATTAVLSVINTAGNPISPWLNIWGLYIWNISSSIFSLFTLIFWGAIYGNTIQTNVAVSPTLIGSYNNDDISLGYSYWLLLAPFLLHIINCVLLYLRQYFIDKLPEISEEKINNSDKDGMIFVY